MENGEYQYMVKSICKAYENLMCAVLTTENMLSNPDYQDDYGEFYIDEKEFVLDQILKPVDNAAALLYQVLQREKSIGIETQDRIELHLKFCGEAYLRQT